MINKEIKQNVRRLLERHPETRDCDLKLVSMYWSEIDGFSDLLPSDIYNGDVTHFESIRRTRQKLQMEFEELRGYKYKVRKNKLEKEVRELIKNDC